MARFVQANRVLLALLAALLLVAALITALPRSLPPPPAPNLAPTPVPTLQVTGSPGPAGQGSGTPAVTLPPDG